MTPPTRATPPKPDGFLWTGVRLLLDPVGTLSHAWRTGGDIVRIPLFPLPIDLYLVVDPESVRRVMQEGNFEKIPVQNRKLKNILGNGLFTSEGRVWDAQRRVMQPLFHPSEAGRLVRGTAAATETMLEQWKRSEQRGQPIDVHRDISSLTLTVMLGLVFPEHTDMSVNSLMKALSISDRHLDKVERVSFIAPNWISYPSGPRVTAARHLIDDFIFSRIAKRRQSGRLGDDMLSALTRAVHPDTGALISDRQIRDEIVTMLMGDRITAPLLVWTLWLLSQHPDVVLALRRDISGLLGSRTVTADDLPKLSYGSRVLSEVLRLYPPAWLIARAAIHDETLGGYHVPAGTRVLVSPYLTQRHPQFWDNPEQFDPDRFTRERYVKRPRFTYFPFGGGLRTCIADSFVTIQANVILTTVLQHCRLRACTTTVRPGASPLLMPLPTPFLSVEWDPIARSSRAS